MQELNQQVTRVRRRLVAQQFVQLLPWCLFSAMLVACIAVAVPKIWVVPAAGPQWNMAWIIGSAVGGLLLCLVWTWVAKTRSLEAAIALDQRFQLKERVSSTLALTRDERESEAGQALIDDAVLRVKRLDVRDEFHVRTGWQTMLPLLAAGLAFLLAFVVDDARQRQAEAAPTEVEQLQKEIEKSAEELKKRLAQRKKDAAEKGLKDAELVFERLEQGLDDIKKNNNGDFKKTLVKINNLTSDLEKRRKELGSTEQLQKQFEQMKKIEQGPADKVTKALKNGNFQKAIEELKKLQDKIAEGELSQEQKDKLAKQIEQLKDQLQQAADEFNQAKKDLQEQIDQKNKEGDKAGAAELQKLLDQLNQQNDTMSKMEQLANSLAQCSECMKSGDMSGAQKALNQLSENLQELQSELNELQTLSEAMEQIADAKDAMCRACQGNQAGNMMGNGFSFSQFGQQGNGNGLGEGQGFGDRPEEETAVGSYDAREKGNLRQGEAVRVGDAFGPNRAGQSTVDLREQIESAMSADPDPIENQRLPRVEKRHSTEYFEKIRKGE